MSSGTTGTTAALKAIVNCTAHSGTSAAEIPAFAVSSPLLIVAASGGGMRSLIVNLLFGCSRQA